MKSTIKESTSDCDNNVQPTIIAKSMHNPLSTFLRHISIELAVNGPRLLANLDIELVSSVVLCVALPLTLTQLTTKI